MSIQQRLLRSTKKLKPRDTKREEIVLTAKMSDL